LTRGRVDGLLGVVAAARLRNQDPHREVDRDAQTPKKREDDEHDAHDVGVNVESFGDATGDTPHHPALGAASKASLTLDFRLRRHGRQWW